MEEIEKCLKGLDIDSFSKRWIDWEKDPGLFRYVLLPDDEDSARALNDFAHQLYNVTFGGNVTIGDGFGWANDNTDGLTMSVDELKRLIMRFEVTQFWDVRLLKPRQQIQIFINFAFYGIYRLGPSSLGAHAGYGLFAVKKINTHAEDVGSYPFPRVKNKLFRYGGRWMSNNEEEDGDPSRLVSHYVVGADVDLIKGATTSVKHQNRLKWLVEHNWVLDGERFFRLGELGRWINHSPDIKGKRSHVQFKLDWDTRGLSFRKWMDSGMPMVVELTKCVKGGEEIFIDYGSGGPQAYTSDVPNDNVEINETGKMVAKSTIYPHEPLRLSEIAN